MTEAIKKAVNVRKGHRIYVKKVISGIKESNKEDLGQYKIEKIKASKDVLVEKLDILQKLDDGILALVEEEKDIKEEIDFTNNFRKKKVKETIHKIDTILLLMEKSTDKVVTAENTGSSQSYQKEKLPKLPFNGEPTEYQLFMDNFKSAIDSNTILTDVDKFVYLKNLLQGKAAYAIQGLPLTDGNYNMALDILSSRFGYKQIITSSHTWKNLMKLPTVINITDIKKIRVILDPLEINIRGLEALGISSDSYGELLLAIVMKKIPEEMRLTLTRQFKGKQWNLGKVLESFRAEVTAREQIQFMSPPNMSMNRPKPNVGPQLATASTLFSSNRNSTCTCCKGGHSSNNCQVVTSIFA